MSVCWTPKLKLREHLDNTVLGKRANDSLEKNLVRHNHEHPFLL